VQFTIDYTPGEAINNLDPSSLRLFYWDIDTGSWSEDGLTKISQDLVNHTITYEVEHFTEFAFFGLPTPSSEQPEAQPGASGKLFLPTLQAGSAPNGQ
jgi:hypothetical protein